MDFPVEADFLADLRRMVVARLAAEGYTADAALATEALLWNLMKVQHRRIERRQRRAEWSKQLRRRQNALPGDILTALGRIVIAAESGDDLNREVPVASMIAPAPTLPTTLIMIFSSMIRSEKKIMMSFVGSS